MGARGSTAADARAVPDDVVIDILWCDVCHSDLHDVQNDRGFSTHPMVPGHEIIGRVSAVGSRVTKVAVGDLVGVGSMVDSCFSCDPRDDGEEPYCPHRVHTHGHIDRRDGLTTYGGYSQTIIVTEAERHAGRRSGEPLRRVRRAGPHADIERFWGLEWWWA